MITAREEIRKPKRVLEIIDRLEAEAKQQVAESRELQDLSNGPTLWEEFETLTHFVTEAEIAIFSLET